MFENQVADRALEHCLAERWIKYRWIQRSYFNFNRKLENCRFSAEQWTRGPKTTKTLSKLIISGGATGTATMASRHGHSTFSVLWSLMVLAAALFALLNVYTSLSIW